MHYIDEAFLGPALMPADPLARSKVRMMTKLMDKCVHVACMTLTFATANREWLARMTPQEMKAELAKSPDRKRAEIKRQVITHGLDAPLVVDAIHQHQKLLDDIEAAIKNGPYLAGQHWSVADAAATPYVWRLDKLKLARMWNERPRVLGWYDRVRSRPSFKAGADDWLSPA